VTGTATGTPECTTHTTKLELLTSQPEVRVGDSVTVTLRLSNIGCAPVGLPAYNLLWSADGSDELFARRSPLSQSFSVGISPGGQHEAEFVLLAVRPGVATFSAHVSFEVHLGYPGPAYWSGDQAGPVALVIREPLPPTIYLPMALNRGGVVSVGRVSAAATVLRR
jgi:hypothetical protein